MFLADGGRGRRALVAKYPLRLDHGITPWQHLLIDFEFSLLIEKIVVSLQLKTDARLRERYNNPLPLGGEMRPRRTTGVMPSSGGRAARNAEPVDPGE